MSDQREPNERSKGQTLALFAVVLIGLMWVMALGIDAAQMMLRQREMQSVADLSTLAGARSLAEATGDATTKACAVAISNGYSCPGEAVVTFPATLQIEVTVTRPVNTFFLRVFGVNTVPAQARARAMGLLPVSGSGYAIYAGASGCSSSPELTLDWSGSTINVIGAVHSDGGIKMGGSTNTVTGPTTYACAGKFLDGGGGNVFNPPAAQAPDQGSSYPNPPSGYDYNVPTSTDFPCTFQYTGDWDLPGGALAPGVYCQLDPAKSIKIGSTVTGNVTLISRGKIDISASSSVLTAHTKGVLLYAGGTGDSVIKVAGSNMTWSGYVYAPNGQIEYSGSTNNTLSGSIIGYKVKLNGSSLTIDASGLGGPAVPAEIRLVQ
jgi:hypothetical protein